MQFAPVFRSEWLKIRTVRSLLATLFALFAVTTAFSALAAVDPEDQGADPLFTALSGTTLGQIAALAFGSLAVSAEYREGAAVRLSLTAVPRRGLWFAAKAAAIAAVVLAVSLVTSLAALLAGSAGLGAAADGLTSADQVRGVLGGAVYLTLMALFAAGLATLLRSGVAHPVGAHPVHPGRVVRGRRRARHRRRLHAGPRRPDGAARRARRNARPLDGACRHRVLDGRGPAGRCVAAAPSGRLRDGRLTRRQLSVAAGLLEP